MSAALALIVAAEVVVMFVALADKVLAVRRRARVPERTLLWLGLVGGVGLWLGMLVARHKVRKPSFWLPAIGVLLVHVLGLAILARRLHIGPADSSASPLGL